MLVVEKSSLTNSSILMRSKREALSVNSFTCMGLRPELCHGAGITSWVEAVHHIEVSKSKFSKGIKTKTGKTKREAVTGP